MSNLIEEIDRITAHELKERHSYFQLQYFLIGKEPTVQSKLWRCIRELKARKEALQSIKMEIEDINDDIELINIEIENFPEISDSLAITAKKREIAIRKLIRRKNDLENRLISLKDKLKNTEEEANFIAIAFNSLEKVEPLKPQDDLESQKKYWNQKLTQEFNLRNIFGAAPDLELIKTILALTSDCTIKTDLLKLINDKNNINKLTEIPSECSDAEMNKLTHA